MELEKHYNIDRLAIVTTSAGEKLLAELNSLSVLSLNHLSQDKVQLNGVRRLAMVTNTRSSQTGAIMSLQVTAIIMPVDINSGPIQSMWATVDTVYLVKDQPGLAKKLDTLLKQAVDDEARMRAESAGLVTR